MTTIGRREVIEEAFDFVLEELHPGGAAYDVCASLRSIMLGYETALHNIRVRIGAADNRLHSVRADRLPVIHDNDGIGTADPRRNWHYVGDDYAPTSPKSSGYHDRMAAIYDMRPGK